MKIWLDSLANLNRIYNEHVSHVEKVLRSEYNDESHYVGPDNDDDDSGGDDDDDDDDCTDDYGYYDDDECSRDNDDDNCWSVSSSRLLRYETPVVFGEPLLR